MTDIVIIYDSKTGNTEKAAGYVLEGVRSAGVSAEMKRADTARTSDLTDAKGIIIGSYCMRDQCSEKIDRFIEGISPGDVAKKAGAAFGSYKFSGGQVQKLETEMASLGISLVAPGVNAIKEPDEQVSVKLRELGKKVGEAVKR